MKIFRSSKTIFFILAFFAFSTCAITGFSDEKPLKEPVVSSQETPLQETKQTELKPSVQELKDLIEQDPIVRMHFTKMIDQVPKFYKDDLPGELFLTSIDQLLQLINDAITKPPEFNESGLVGFPINAILNWTMGVPDGYAAFRNEKVNKVFREILNEYGRFLDSKASLGSLNDSPTGWKSQRAQELINIEEYIHDPNDPHWGFTSWNDFFTRDLKPGMRPIAEPDNSKIITSGCDSEVFAIQRNVKTLDWFWVKSQPYSLRDIFQGNEKLAKEFEGGDIYQAFLSAFKYHHWHSPITGTIKEARVIPGTYYSATEAVGMDPASPNLSQGYIAHVATRAIILIEADDPSIGLVAMIPIGMAEVSSNIINDDIKPGYHVKKGEKIGYFQYGGSSYLLIFKKGVIKEFNLKKGNSVKVGEKIATTH